MTQASALQLPAVESTSCGASIATEPLAPRTWPYWSLMATGFPTGFRPVLHNTKNYDFALFVSTTTNGWFNEGSFLVQRSRSPQRALAELRSKTELTWGQLARALGVNRRSLHFWAQGERPSASNLERLMELVEIVRGIDDGDPTETTEILLEPHGGEPSMFALLCDQGAGMLPESTRPARVPRAVSGRTRRPPQLSQEERARREGLAPWERIASLPEGAEREAGRLIASDKTSPRSE